MQEYLLESTNRVQMCRFHSSKQIVCKCAFVIVQKKYSVHIHIPEFKTNRVQTCIYHSSKQIDVNVLLPECRTNEFERHFC
jgi:hypothetical protein